MSMPIITGRPAHSAAMPVLFLLTGPKMGFSPHRATHIAPINVKVGTGSGPQVRAPVPTFTFIGAKMWEYSPQ